MLTEIALFLAAAVIAVPLFKRFGLGAVLGYLFAGMLIGPSGFGMIDNVERVLHASEFGVVLLMFVIGLELQISRLWLLRTHVFGLGGAQVMLSTAALSGLALFFGLPPVAALVAGFELASRPEYEGKLIVVIIPSFAERYLSTALFEGL